MEKTDLKELRKVIKAKDHIVDWVYCLYVDSENTPVYETVGKLADMEEGDRFRHLNLFTKVLSTRLGQDSFAQVCQEVVDQRCRQPLEDLRGFGRVLQENARLLDREKVVIDERHSTPP